MYSPRMKSIQHFVYRVNALYSIYTSRFIVTFDENHDGRDIVNITTYYTRILNNSGRIESKLVDCYRNRTSDSKQKKPVPVPELI